MSEENIDNLHKIITDIISSRKEKFISGKTFIPTGLAVYNQDEINAIIDSLLTGWFGLSVKGKEFENKFAEYITSKYCTLVNSGSSANLLALNGVKNKLGLNGGEIITPACCFPTTINPILQLGFKPALIDIDKTLNITPELVSGAITKDTKGIMFSHTLGNPCKIEEIKEIADEKGLFIIEDCCDAYGSTYAGKMCGSWGLASTFSFYPAHNITLGEGGAVTTDDKDLKRIILSLRDWGRDCWCEAGKDDTCRKRFEYNLGDIPYDHKYLYSQVGYNMKPMELQAAMGLIQMKKIGEFNKARKRNFKIYSEELSVLDEFLGLPKINDKADPVFFGLPLMIKDNKTKRHDLINFLNKNKIGTRLLFAGNILYQPAYKSMVHSLYGNLDYTDDVARNLFWIGIHPGIGEETIKYIISRFKEYFKG